jgi:hypothetical protein
MLSYRPAMFGLACWLCGLSVAAAQTPPRVVEMTAEPARAELRHADDRQQLIITGKLADGTVRDLTRNVQYVSTNPSLVAVSGQGLITPRGTGNAAIQVIGPNGTLSVPVVSANSARPISFANDVMPILAKAGCNSGACHGAASGKKGFKVSLRGYDPAGDYLTLTRGTESRRLQMNAPEESLLLLKPLGLVAHEGGKRFDIQSGYAKSLVRWLAEGARSDVSTAVPLVGLEVTPAFRTFSTPGLQQQLLVTARFGDGSRRDVTADARYSSSNERAADPDEAGLVSMNAKGEAAVTVRYGSLVAVSTLVILKQDPAFQWPNLPEGNYIDRLVHAKLKPMQVIPSELASDEEFVRRVYYDLIGTPPTPEEIRAFLGDKATDKRARLIDNLLERPEHAEFWALKWGDLLKIRFDLMRDKGTWGMYRWLRDSIAANKPFNQLVHEVVAAEGSCDENPAANFWRVFTDRNDASEALVQVFFGIRLLCAKCHDHPFEKWVQKDYYGMSAFFSQVNRKPNGRREDVVVFRVETPASAAHPNTGEALVPKFLDGRAVKVDATGDARALLADWIASKDNPFLARATVNRLWSHLFAKGIIDPVDDIRSSNPPANGPLLEALTKDFVDHNFDVRHILRTIANSHAYQRSARTNSTNAEDRDNFSHYVPKRLSAEQLLDTLSQATGVRESFFSRFGAGAVAQPVGGLRATQLPDRALTAETLELFGRPRGESSCACERNDEASMTQALHLINGKSLADRLANPGGRVAQLVARPKVTNEQILDELYLAVLCRLPRDNERTVMMKHLAATNDKLKAAQDVMWVLFNTKEMLFNH